MKCRFTSAAETEFIEAIQYYEQVDKGLGVRFYHEVQNTTKRIADQPLAWKRLKGDIHRCRVKVFPYGLIYQARMEEVLVLAVMHFKRRPDYWEDRI